MMATLSLEVRDVIERAPITYTDRNGVARVVPSSGATFYTMNNTERSSVKHTTHDTWVCLLSTCKATYVEGHERWKGCEHTKVAIAAMEARGGDTITRAAAEAALLTEEGDDDGSTEAE